MSEDLCESKLNGQTDSHSDYSGHMCVMQNFDTLLLLMFLICKIDIIIFGIFLRCNLSWFCIQVVAGQCLNKQVCDLIKIYHAV